MLGKVIEIIHYCRMVQTCESNQRPFDETVCDASITNGDVIKPSKRCKTFAMTVTSNAVHIGVACAMRGNRLIQQNCWR